jgi:LPS export ABC transporter protein LptC/lipopolysaccharide transport protein LptA
VRPWISGFSYLLVFLAVWFLWPREMDGFTPGRNGRLQVPDYAMTNTRYVSVKEGKVEMESISQESLYHLAKREMTSKKVTSYFYDQQGQKTEVQAEEALFIQDQRQVILTNQVRSRSPDGFVMNGSKAIYQLDKRFLISPEPITGEMEDKSLQVWGNRAESDLNKREVELIGDAIAQFPERKRGLTKVRGDRAHMDRTQDLVTFTGNVKVNQGETVATSQRANLYYAAQQKNVKYMSMLEDVEIKEGNRRTRSQVAEFFAPTDTIVLSSFPSVYHGNDVVTGDRIILYRATGVVEVTGTNAAAQNPERTKGVPGNKPEPELTEEDRELVP